MSDHSPKRTRHKHLEPESCNDERTTSFEFTIPNPNRVNILRMQLVEKEAIDRRLQREREEVIMKDFEEKKHYLGEFLPKKGKMR